MGSLTLRALAKGWTEKIGEKLYRVHVTHIAVFVHDIYNFVAAGVEWLGFWSCKHKDVSISLGVDYWLLKNQDFRSYQNRLFLGHDYLVLSKPHLVEDFEKIIYDYSL